MQLRTILCPIDFSDVSAREIDVAAEVARAFGARLVLHHNRTALTPGLGRQWDWDATHPSESYTDADAERHLQNVLASLPAEARGEGLVSAGPLGPAVLAIAEALPADLVVLGSHGWTSEDHASVADRLIRQAPCPVLTFDEHAQASARFRLAAADGEAAPCVSVPTDFSETGGHAVAYALSLAQALPVKVHLLHVLPAAAGVDATTSAEIRLGGGVPHELRDRVTVDVREGDPATEIVAHATAVGATFIVLGEHARGFLRSMLTRDTTRAVVHAASCPVWVVPRRTAA
mgnify:CR=1 FL=1